MNLILKFLLLSLCALILTAMLVQAEEDKWIDGIRFRPAAPPGVSGPSTRSQNPIVIYMPWKIEGRISPYFSDPPNTAAIAGKHTSTTLFPFALELPETLMTSWSFRGALFEFEFPTEVKDLRPGFNSISEVTNYLRQDGSDRTSLYNDFFNASDKTFADANSNWALSADVTSSRVFLGYNWGFFIPIGDYHRFFKFGAGLGVYYIDLSFKLNLCSQYKVPQGSSDPEWDGVNCVGKTEIDSYSGKKSGVASSAVGTAWERRTKDSIWRFLQVSESVALGSNDKGYLRAKLKNHSKRLALWMSSSTWEIISYTYRF